MAKVVDLRNEELASKIQIASAPRRLDSSGNVILEPKAPNEEELAREKLREELLKAMDLVSSERVNSGREGQPAITKIGNLIDFQLADLGSELINDVQTCHFFHLEEAIIAKNPNKLAGLRINLVMDFNEVNGWFAMALFRMGARVKWASNRRNAY